jgi:signal peptidase I
MLGRFLPICTFEVWGKSMEPTFREGRRVFVDKTAYALRGPKVGDAVVLRHPKTKALMVKRVVALPRQRVRTQWGRLFVDQTRFEHPYTEGGFIEDADTRAEWAVPKNAYFVLGDNPILSTDSRHFGCVNKGAIVGQVVGIS